MDWNPMTWLGSLFGGVRADSKPAVQDTRNVAYDLVDVDGKHVNLSDGAAVPHVILFDALYHGAWQQYLVHRHDDALRAGYDQAQAMLRDEHLTALLFERMRSLTRLSWHLEVDDERDPYQKFAANVATRLIRRTPNFRGLLRSLAWALWPGRSGCQLAWDWEHVVVDGVALRGLVVKQHSHVNGDKIGFRHDHTPFLLVHAGEADERLPDSSLVYTSRARAVELVGGWRERVIIHKVNCFDMPFEQGERADAIHGLGIRHYLHWSWFLKQEWITSVIQALDRLGLGLLVVEYDESNPQAKLEAIDAAKNLQAQRSVIVVPRAKNSASEGAVRVVDTPVAGAQVMLQLQQACELREERFIVGQAGSSRSQASGMGNEASAEFMQATKHDITEEDAQDLAETLTGSDKEPGLVSVIKRWSLPWADFPIRFRFKVKPPNMEQLLGTCTMAYNLGLPVRADDVREMAGLTKPNPDDEVLQSPAFVQAQMEQAMMQAQLMAGSPLGDDGEVDHGDPLFDEAMGEATSAHPADHLGDWQ